MESVTPRPIAVFTFIKQPEILLVWLLFSLLLGVLLSLPLGYLMILALPFWVVLGVLIIQYGFVIIEFTARGHHDVPRMSAGVFATDPRVYRQALVILTMVSLVLATPEVWRFASLSVALMITPAMTAFITFHLPLIRVFDPRHIWQFIRSMGYTYVTLRVMITSILMLLLLLMEQVVHLVDIRGGGFLMAGAITYLLLTLFRGTGALLYSRRRFIGINTDFSLEQAQQAMDEERGAYRRNLVSELALLCRRDRWHEAWEKPARN
jgi:hypothetical protein